MQPFPNPSDATNKIWSILASEIFKFESVDNDDGDGRRTDDGPLVYYKLTLWAFGSGELKTGENLSTF